MMMELIHSLCKMRKLSPLLLCCSALGQSLYEGDTPVCPTHEQIRAHAYLQSVDFEETKAIMHFNFTHSKRNLKLSFRLPAAPPFARPISSHYHSDTQAYNRGFVNWGFTAYYQQDFASRLLEYIAFRNIYYVTDNLVDCLYLSTLESYFLYGHIWIEL